MYRDKVIIVSKKNELYSYFSKMCMNSKNLKNVTNFYIRQCMTGLKKSPELRQPNETEVLHYVFTTISKLNDIRMNTYNKKVNKVKQNKELDSIEKETLLNELSPLLFEYPSSSKWFISYNILDGILKVNKNTDYLALPSQVNQAAMKEVYASWKGYFNALKDYKRNPSKYTGKPKLPKYIKDPMSTCVFTNIVCKLGVNENGKTYLRFPLTNSKLWLGKYINPEARLKQVKVKPLHDRFEVHIILEEPDTSMEVKEPKNIIALDLGVDNIATISNNIGLPPIVIKGNVLKSKNQWFNKKIAYYQSILMKVSGNTNYKTSKRIKSLYVKRHLFIKDYFHKIALAIINYCLENDIDTIVVGKNTGLKQSIDIGKANNQNILNIPHTILENNLKYLCEYNSLNYIEQEESYTSKASFLDLDDIPIYKKGKETKYSFSGTRIKRGLYKTKDGRYINADVNGASNILRKAIPTAFDKVTDFSYLTKTVVSWHANKWYKSKTVKGNSYAL